MKETVKKTDGLVLSPDEAEEYCAYKRQKRVEEVRAALMKTEMQIGTLSIPELRRVCDEAKKVKCRAVRLPSGYIDGARTHLCESGTHIDCEVGTGGESAVKCKLYEGKYALRHGAKELTLVLSPSMIKNGRWWEIKREIKKFSTLKKRATLKLTAGSQPTSELIKIAGILSAYGIKFLSVPFFVGVDGLKGELKDRCMLEVTDVESSTDFKTLILAGVERIVTPCPELIFSELIKEAENCTFSVPYAEPYLIPNPTLSPRSVYAAKGVFAPTPTPTAEQVQPKTPRDKDDEPQEKSGDA